MSSTTFTRRAYHSAVREQQAEITRNKILDAAEKLFAEQGYNETSIAAIAHYAGVAPQTVYASVGSKHGMILGIIHRIREDKKLLAKYMKARTTGDTVLLTHELVSIVGEVYSTRNILFDRLFDALAASPDLREKIYLERLAEREALRGFIDLLREWGTLRPELNPEEALDILWTMTAAPVYLHLVKGRHWELEHYKSWLERLLLRELTYITAKNN